MIENHLTPVESARLANEIYRVNEDDPIKLRDFLLQPLFRQGGTTSPQVLKAKVGGRIIRAAEDAFGVAAFGAPGTPYANDLFLIFRGTTTANRKADFVTDARVGLNISKKGKPVHAGFNHTFNSMIRPITDFIAGQTFSGRVHCIGHSLGGAVASLAADWCHPNVSREVILYTFGQPRVGLMVFSSMTTLKLKKANIHRVFNTTDPVPMVPIFPYTHLPFGSYGHRLDSDDLITSGDAHKMTNYIGKINKLKTGTWQGVPRAKALFDHEHAIEEYLNSRRYENPMYPHTFEMLEGAIHWMLRKVLKNLVEVVNLVAIGVHTFIDLLAKELHKIALLADASSELVKKFMRKVIRVLGIPEKILDANISLSFFTHLLRTLTRRMYELAQKAIRGSQPS